MSVRVSSAVHPIPRFLKWFPILAAILIIVQILLSQPQAIRYDGLRVRAADPKWFSVNAPNGSYSFAGVTAPTEMSPTSVPDSDGDGILDTADSCPTVPGIPGNKGCPSDQDQDGIPDSADTCPIVAGNPAFGGCPPPTPTPALPGLPATGPCVIASRSSLTVNVREEPDRNARVVGSLPYNLTPNVLGRTINDAGEEWFQVEGGWVAGSVTRRGGDCNALQDPFGVAPPLETPEAFASPLPVATQPSSTSQLPVAAAMIVDNANPVVPQSRGLIQVRDQASGQEQIFLVADGAMTPLPPVPPGAIIFPALEPFGDNIAFLSADASGVLELRLMNLSLTGQATVLFRDTADFQLAPYPVVWAPNAGALLFTIVNRANNTAGIYRLNFQSGTPTGQADLIVPDGFAPMYSQEGDHVAYVMGTSPNRAIQILSLVDNSVTPVAVPAPFSDCTMPVFGLNSTDLIFVCQLSGQTLLVRYNQGIVTPVAVPSTAIVNLVTTATRYLLVNSGATIYAGALNALVLTPVIGGSGQPIQYIQWLQGEGPASG